MLRELPAHPARVATDDDAAHRGARDAGEQLLRQPPRRPDDDGEVHPVGTRSEDATQTRRSELERAGEPVRQVGRREVRLPEQSAKLVARVRIGIVGHPALGALPDVG